MLDSTLELISQAASNSLLVFCFCNLIIVIILVGLKPVSNTHQQVNSRNSNHNIKGGDATSIKRFETVAKNALVEVSHESNVKKAAEDVEDQGRNENNDNDGQGHSSEEEEEVEDDDDELRKRVEEFIEKVNDGWKAEILTSLKRTV